MRFISQMKKPLLPCGGFSLKHTKMILNGINFNDAWLAKFKSAEEFINHQKVQFFIERKMVTKEDLHSFFELFQSQQTVGNGNINQNVSGQIQEAQPESSNSGDSQGEEGSHSGSAGNTDEPRRKGRRK